MCSNSILLSLIASGRLASKFFSANLITSGLSWTTPDKCGKAFKIGRSTAPCPAPTSTTF